MKKNEKLVIQGNEFYVIDLDCLEKKKKEKNNAERNKGKKEGNFQAGKNK